MPVDIFIFLEFSLLLLILTLISFTSYYLNLGNLMLQKGEMTDARVFVNGRGEGLKYNSPKIYMLKNDEKQKLN